MVALFRLLPPIDLSSLRELPRTGDDVELFFFALVIFLLVRPAGDLLEH